MIVVGGGSSTRFGADKLLARVGGTPLVEHTVRAVAAGVDSCILVCRPDQMAAIRMLDLGVELVAGGRTRTDSEMAGLTQLNGSHGLIAIHDAARPLVSPQLVARLFEAAARDGGAIPVVDAPSLVDKRSLARLPGVAAAQTPQVFDSRQLRRAYEAARAEGFDGHDTAEVVARFTDTRIAAVPGEPNNLKVTYPEDLGLVEELLSRDRS